MARYLITVAAVLLVNLSGCAPLEDHFQVTGDATEEEVAIMQEASDAWCEASEGAWCARIDREEGANKIRIVPVGVLPGKDHAIYTHHRGLYEWHEIRITDRRDRETWEFDLYFTVVHELGHAYGLHHQSGTVMQVGYDRKQFTLPEGVTQ
jgi:hypothetical protein